MDTLILVDKNDRETGYEEKERCHLIPTRLHRAFSIFILNTKGEMLIHKRCGIKQTWPGFWTNACCSHPGKGESLETATKRRLQEELGFKCDLKYLFPFHYKTNYDKRYGENEIDHVFWGTYDGIVKPNREEIEDWKFMTIEKLLADIKKHPERYTPWFKKALPRVLKHIQKA